MKKSLFVVVVAAGLALASCAPFIYVTQDYDRRADFSAYKTFDWMPRPERMPRSAWAAIERSPFLNKRIMDVTNQILATKGLTRTSSNPDLLINFYVGFNDRADIANWGYYYGPYWGFYWPGLGPMDVYTYKEGTLIMDFVDAKKNEMVWRGVAEEDVFTYDRTPTISEAEVWRILSKLLSQFPPQRYHRYQR